MNNGMDIDTEVSADINIDVGVDILADVNDDVLFDEADADEQRKEFDDETVAGLARKNSYVPYASIPKNLIRVIRGDAGIETEIVSGEWGETENSRVLGTIEIIALKRLADIIKDWLYGARCPDPNQFVNELRLSLDDFETQNDIEDRTLRGVVGASAVDFFGCLIPLTELFA